MSDEEISRIVHGGEFRFEEAVSYFDKKVPVTAGVFYDLADHYRALAFTVSGYTEAQIIKKFYDELLDALENGTTMEQFRQSMSGFLERQGYEGLTPFQADNIFRTNIQTAYQAGHYEQMTDPDVMRLRPYWQYDAVNDSHTARRTWQWTAGFSRRIPRSGIHGIPPMGSGAAVPSPRCQPGRSKSGG